MYIVLILTMFQLNSVTEFRSSVLLYLQDRVAIFPGRLKTVDCKYNKVMQQFLNNSKVIGSKLFAL